MKFTLIMASFLMILILCACGNDESKAGNRHMGNNSRIDKDCKDFATQEQAQAYFNSLGGSSTNNIDRLDGNDRDGIVCESNPSAFNLSSQEDSRIQISILEFSGKVIRVLDGDTIKVVGSGKTNTIRLSEIDCPEKNQAFGGIATEFTSNLALGEIVTLTVSDIDRYGRLIAKVKLPDGQNLNRELVRVGLSWWYERFSNDLSLRDLEGEARDKKIGLWSASNPVPPWDFR